MIILPPQGPLESKPKPSVVETEEESSSDENDGLIYEETKVESQEDLIKCLGNQGEDWRNRETAKDALSKISDVKILQQIAPYLDDKYSMRTRQLVAEVINDLAIAGITDSALIDPLINCLNGYDTHLRRMVVEVLGNIKDPKALTPLKETLLKDNDSQVTNNAAIALSKIEKDKAIPDVLLTAFVETKEPRIKRNILEALVKLDNPVLVSILLAASTEQWDYDLRKIAISEFSNIKDEVLKEGLNTYIFNESNIQAKAFLLAALSNINDSRIVPFLIKALNSDEPNGIKQLCIRALLNLDPEATEKGLKQCEANDIKMTNLISNIISNLSDANASHAEVVPVLVKCLVDENEDTKIKLIAELLLTSMNNDLVKEGLEKCKSNENEMVRLYAEMCLGNQSEHGNKEIQETEVKD